MNNHVHVLPVGFDSWRLTEPLRSGDYTVDEVVLVSPADEGEGSTRPIARGKSAFLARIRRAVERELEDRFPVDSAQMPPLHRYEQVYAWAYRYLLDLTSDATVHLNLSSLPKSAAVAVVQATTALKADSPEIADRLEVYYVPIERYLGVEAFDALGHHERTVEGLADAFDQYSRIQPELFEAVVEPIRTRLKDLSTHLETVQHHVNDGETVSEGTHATPQECLEAISAVEDEFDHALRGEEGFEEDWEAAFSAHEVQPLPRAKDLQKLIRSLPETAVPAGAREDLRSDLKELLRLVERFTTVQEALMGLEMAVDEVVAESAVQPVVEEIAQYGMTRGYLDAGDGPERISIPVPPTHSLREVEIATLFVLSEYGKARSVKELAGKMTTALTELIDEVEATEDAQSSTEDDIQSHIQRMRDQDDGGSTRTELESAFMKALRSRLQYNLESLVEKGYVIRKQSTTDSRQREIELSQVGRLWLESHEYEETGRPALETLLAEMIQKVGT